ncbi:hypothetical protein CsSME_00014252 [Camellia sinensis var. sinensis]
MMVVVRIDGFGETIEVGEMSETWIRGCQSCCGVNGSHSCSRRWCVRWRGSSVTTMAPGVAAMGCDVVGHNSYIHSPNRSEIQSKRERELLKFGERIHYGEFARLVLVSIPVSCVCLYQL